VTDTTTTTKGAKAPEGWHPLEAWRIVRKRWLPFVTVLALAIGVASVVTLKTTPEYRAISSLNIEGQIQRRTNFQNVDSFDTFNQDYYQTQYKVLQSRTMSEKTMTKLKLWERPEFGGERDPVEAFQKKLEVAPVRNSRIVTVAFEHPDPKLAAEIVNVLVQEYRTDSVNRRVSALREINKQLQSESGELLEKLEQGEKTLQDYNQKHQLASVDEKQNVATRRLDDSLVALAKVEEELARLIAVQEQVAKGNGDVERLFSLKGVLDSKMVQDLVSEESRIKRELADLRKRYKPEHPVVKQVEAQLDDTVLAIKREVQRVVSSINSQVEEAGARVESAKIQLAARKQEKLDLDRTISGAEILKRSRDGTKVLYDSLLTKIKESEVSSALEINNTSVVDAAIPPRLPSRPNWKMNLGLGIGAGILLGIGLIALLERIDSTVKTREEIEELLGLPVIGMVPAVAEKDGAPETVAMRDAKSGAAEAFRAVRTALLLSPKNGVAPKRVLVTSSGPGEGKTCNSLNLAAALAQAGKRTLLIDCDFHRPQMHKHLGLSNEKGLSDALIGNGSIENYVQSTSLENLRVMSTGPTPPKPSELLGMPKLAERLAEAMVTYDHIILDTPPVCAVTDAAVIAPHSDAVVLIVQPGLTDRGGAKRTVEVLSGVGVTPLGVVLNNLSGPTEGYSYYYPKYGTMKRA